MSKLRIETMVLGMVSTNTYILYKEGENQAVIVDPAAAPERILEKCRQLSLTPAAILLTHGHFDHIGAVIAGEKEDGLMRDPIRNLSSQFGSSFTAKATRLVKDGDVISLLGMEIQVMETPGHTPGSVCYYIPDEEVLLSGDTLFCESYGRTDFPGGSGSQMIQSIGRLLTLPEETMVYPGHEGPTAIGHEKQYNPITAYLR